MLVMDSGLGGISVVRALRSLAPPLPLMYLADTAGFPYGNRTADDITARAITVLEMLASMADLSTVVLACNTLSTLSLHALRERFPYRFVGTVPAIKVAANQSLTRRFTLLATPNTAHSEYSQRLIADFAKDCVVDCYGAPNLAAMAESFMLGTAADDDTLRRELAPAFFDDARGKTDAIILGCTHYPLLLPQLQRVAPWPVTWIDSSQAIARQALAQFFPMGKSLLAAYVTAPSDVARYSPVLAAEGFASTTAVTLQS